MNDLADGGRPPIPVVHQTDLGARPEAGGWSPHVRARTVPARERPPHASNGLAGRRDGGRLVTAEFRGIERAEAAAELLLGLGGLGARWSLQAFHWEGTVVTAQLALREDRGWPAAYSSK